MNFRGTYWLFGIAVAIFAAVVVTLFVGDKAGGAGALFPGLRAAKLEAKDIDALEVEVKNPKAETLAFARGKNNRWVLEKPYKGRVDSGQVDSLVRDLIEAKTIENPADMSRNLAQLGLDSPDVTVTLRKGDKSWSLNVGNVTIGTLSNAIAYVTTSEAPREPAAVRKQALQGLLKQDLKTDVKKTGEMVRTLADFRLRDVFGDGGIVPDNIQAVALKAGDKDVALKRVEGTSWKFEKPAGFADADYEGEGAAFGEKKNYSGVRDLLTGLTGLSVKPEDYLGTVPGDVGLDPAKPETMRLEVTRAPLQFAEGDKTPVTDVLLVGKKADEKGEAFYAKREDDPTVFKLPASALEPFKKLLERPEALRDRNLLALNVPLVDAIDVKAGERTLELRKTGDPKKWRLYDTGTAVDAAAPAVDALLNGLTARRVVRDFPSASQTDAALGLDKPAAEVSFWQEGVKPAEGDAAKAGKPELKGPPTVRLLFGKRDKDIVYVRRIKGDEKVDVAVPEYLLGTVTRERVEYLDPTLPSFLTDKAEKLTFNRGAEKYEVEKVKKEGQAAAAWTIKAPASLAGRPADPAKVNAVLTDLSTLKAQRLVAERASDREMERFGLKPPRIEAAVTLAEEKDKTRTYLFGGEAGQAAAGVYAKVGERDLVFVAPKSATATLETADLQDPTVFRFDVAKVKAIKLTGYADVVGGEPLTRELEKTDKGWQLKGGAFEIEPTKVENFLLDLASPRAERFVARGGGAKPEHKLDVKAGALEVAVTVDGEKEPFVLTVGAATPDGKEFYAQAKNLPGDVFTVLKDRFAPVKERPTHFKKGS